MEAQWDPCIPEVEHESALQTAQCILCGRERKSSNTLRERWATAWEATWGGKGKAREIL